MHVASNQSASKWDPHEKRPTASLANEMDEDVETQSKTERIFGPFGQAINLQCSGKPSCQDSYQEIHEFARSCKIVSRNSRNPVFTLESH